MKRIVSTDLVKNKVIELSKKKRECVLAGYLQRIIQAMSSGHRQKEENRCYIQINAGNWGAILLTNCQRKSLNNTVPSRGIQLLTYSHSLLFPGAN